MMPLSVLSHKSIRSGLLNIMRMEVALFLLNVGTRNLESSDLAGRMPGAEGSLTVWTTWMTQCLPGIKSHANAADFGPRWTTFSGILSEYPIPEY
jgi:hypothetical protein